jgi:hypothetical protein
MDEERAHSERKAQAKIAKEQTTSLAPLCKIAVKLPRNLQSICSRRAMGQQLLCLSYAIDSQTREIIAEWLRNPFTTCMKLPRNRSEITAELLYNECTMAAQWLYNGSAVAVHGCAMAVQWLRNGCAMASQWLCNGLIAAQRLCKCAANEITAKSLRNHCAITVDSHHNRRKMESKQK